MAVKNRIAGTAHTTNLVEHGIVERQTLLNVMQPAQPGVGIFRWFPREVHPAARTIC
jgi:hypothetical protein